MIHETLSTIEWGEDSGPAVGAAAAGSGPGRGPFDWLPKLSSRQVRLEHWLGTWSRDGRVPPALEWLEAGCGGALAVDRPEVLLRASGLNRPGMIAHLNAPRLATRLAIGIENALAHAVVDRLLGFDRDLAETRLQLTPVEWGIWTFLILRAVDGLDRASAADQPPSAGAGAGGPLGLGDLRLDRAGPDPFEPSGLGSIVTVRWGVRIGATIGSVRLWIPESLVPHWLESPPRPTVAAATHGPGRRVPRGELAGGWRAEAGTIALPMGLRRLRAGGVVPLTDSPLSGSPGDLEGPVDLVLDLDGAGGRFRIPARPVAGSGGRFLRVAETPRHEPRPRDSNLVPVKETRTMSQPTAPTGPPSPPPEVAPLDVPVTLTVELGRVNLTVSRLADLRPGDVVELSRHSRAPVELTSNGRLVARGELILIDTDLGVRITSVFL